MTRVIRTGRDNWQPRNPTGRYDEYRLERSPSPKPRVWPVALVLIASALFIGCASGTFTEMERVNVGTE